METNKQKVKHFFNCSFFLFVRLVCGEVEALRSVLSAGANVAIPDVNGGTPLHYAAQMCGANYDGKLGQSGSTKMALEILNILLAHPQSSVDVQDKDGRQPLLWAASAGSAKAVIALVKAGARVESADNFVFFFFFFFLV